ncbi:MAG: GIY-YIG nuclease family protein [Candidatus Paceibacterota bacterium]|jgi:putative endonuclease
MNNQLCVYILKNKSNKYYVGSTDNLDRRLHQHKMGYTQTTRNMKSFQLVLKQDYSSLEMARKIERKIKKLKRKDYIEKMIKEGYIKLVI